MIQLLDYLFIENCRVCQKLILPEESEAHTLCTDCWEPLNQQEAQLDICLLPGLGQILVAHAAVYEESMKLLIHKLKYGKDRLIARDLGKVLLKAFRLITAYGDLELTPYMVPIPLSRWRKIQRGFNQSELLASIVSKELKVSMQRRLLSRQKHTKPQHQLSKVERVENLRDAFRTQCQIKELENRRIILVDDIHTSGATLKEAATVLYAAGAKEVSAITVARALLH